MPIVARVDPRIELLSIVFRLAGNPEYNMDQLPAYSADIGHYFSKYENHPAVLMAKRLAAKNGVYFDAVMAMAVHLSAPPALSPLVPFTNDVPERRWGKENATAFVQALRDFYRDSNFQAFFVAHEPMYKLAETRFQSAALSRLDLDWYKRFYGEASQGRFNLILGMNNGGGNYGPHVVFPDGQEEIYAIIGCWTKDDSGNPIYNSAEYLPTIIHEFNHSFVNPIMDRHETEFATAANQVYSRVAAQMKDMAYGNAETMVNESLVRAAVILYFEAHKDSPSDIKRKIVREEANGFVWMDKLCDLLGSYESHRNRYPTFSSFVPQVSQFYHSLAPQVTNEISDFNNECVHVTGLRPFANHSDTVDPDVKEIIVSFDKPLRAGVSSINFGPGGKEQYPITGDTEFLPGDTSIELPVQLKPDSTYNFVLTSWGFQSPDGHPLTSYAVDFRTGSQR